MRTPQSSFLSPARRGLRQGGFTLVELMVALVCMSLIAGLAFPYAELVLQRRKEADLRLYRAKHDGRGSFRFFEPEMDAAPLPVPQSI